MRNRKIAKIEVDLVLKKNHLLMVEVKSLRSAEEIGFRVSAAQINRLLHARAVLQNWKNQSVELIFAFVLPTEIIFLPVDSFL